MIGKIKGLMDVKNDIDKVAKAMQKLEERIQALGERIDQVDGKMADVVKNADQRFGALAKSLQAPQETLEEAAQSLKDEVYDFKMLKSRVQEQILTVFKDELHKEILRNLEVLREDALRYQKVRDEVKTTGLAVQGVSGELRRFQEVAKTLKKEDFQLVNYAKKMESLEGERLRFMRRIDDLERMIGKLRRGQRREGPFK